MCIIDHFFRIQKQTLLSTVSTAVSFLLWLFHLIQFSCVNFRALSILSVINYLESSFSQWFCYFSDMLQV